MICVEEMKEGFVRFTEWFNLSLKRQRAVL